MPCRTDDYYDKPKNSGSVTLNQYNELKKEADNVTRLLCSVIETLEKHDYPNLSKIDGLKDWWDYHKEIDRQRIEKEVQHAEKLLKDLSEEAKELLFKKLQNKK